jgi:hypothetical protein
VRAVSRFRPGRFTTDCRHEPGVPAGAYRWRRSGRGPIPRCSEHGALLANPGVHLIGDSARASHPPEDSRRGGCRSRAQPDLALRDVSVRSDRCVMSSSAW